MPATAERRATNPIVGWCFRLESFARRFDHGGIQWESMDGAEGGVQRVLEDLRARLAGIAEPGPVDSPFEEFVNEHARMLAMLADHVERVAKDLDLDENALALDLHGLADELGIMYEEWWAAIGGPVVSREAPPQDAARIDINALRCCIEREFRAQATTLPVITVPVDEGSLADPLGDINDGIPLIHLDVAYSVVSDVFEGLAGLDPLTNRHVFFHGGYPREDWRLPPRDAMELRQWLLAKLEGDAGVLDPQGQGRPHPTLEAGRAEWVLHLDAALWAVEKAFERYDPSGEEVTC